MARVEVSHTVQIYSVGIVGLGKNMLRVCKEGGMETSHILLTSIDV